jgi:hypothetical protein
MRSWPWGGDDVSRWRLVRGHPAPHALAHRTAGEHEEEQQQNRAEQGNDASTLQAAPLEPPPVGPHQRLAVDVRGRS